MAIYHQAKGAITVATERKEDSLKSKVIEESIPGLSSYKRLSITDPEAISELSERTHYSLFLVGSSKILKFKDNEGNSQSKVVLSFQNDCKILSKERCLEVKVNSNIDPTSFRAICG